MIVLTAKYHLRSSDDFPAVRDALEAMAERVRAEEPACTLYQVSRSTEHDDVLLLYEHYADETALVAHRETPHFQELIEGRVIPLLEKREREVYELLLS